jgi:hypothetical protein
LPDIRAALRLEHKPVEVGGVRFLLRRPTVADLAAATQAHENDPAGANGFMLSAHVLDEQGIPVWADAREAQQCPLNIAHGLVKAVEGLYAEGRD